MKNPKPGVILSIGDTFSFKSHTILVLGIERRYGNWQLPETWVQIKRLPGEHTETESIREKDDRECHEFLLSNARLRALVDIADKKRGGVKKITVK